MTPHDRVRYFFAPLAGTYRRQKRTFVPDAFLCPTPFCARRLCVPDAFVSDAIVRDAIATRRQD